MNADVKRLWLDALRSGDYVQGTGTLCGIIVAEGPPIFCCLGVLCDIAVKQGVPVVLRDFGNEWAFDENVAVLPERVAAWAGLESVDPRVKDGAWPLTDLNDSGVSFAEIADAIEEYL